jgi:Phage integrase family
VPAHGTGDALSAGQATAQGRGQLRDTLHISQRPAEAADRAVPGHWEGDLVFGRRPSAVGTLVERHSRYVLLFPLPDGFTAERMRQELATVDRALAELAAAGAAAVDARTGRWMLRPAAQHPLLEAVDLHGAHDFRHTFSTWLEDAGIPARVIDELMGHQASGRAGRHPGSAIGAYYRHTTPEMAARVVAAVEERLVVVLATAEATLDRQPW